jgi:hypothetical protein
MDVVEVPLPVLLWAERSDVLRAPILVPEVREWCWANLHGRWFTKQRFGPIAGDPDYQQVICFERTTDAIHFKLRWGDA